MLEKVDLADVVRTVMEVSQNPLVPGRVRVALGQLLGWALNAEDRLKNLEQAGFEAGPQPKGSDYGKAKSG